MRLLHLTAAAMNIYEDYLGARPAARVDLDIVFTFDLFIYPMGEGLIAILISSHVCGCVY